jgi:hypothetical protein
MTWLDASVRRSQKSRLPIADGTVLMSAQGQAVPDIAHLLDCSPECVRGVIHAFNGIGVRRAGLKMERGQAEDDR